ncbi:hypothetical protein A3L12_02190 [Thermococcus sp. P6]|nr:hypothetical protein [Thermococcus sp. P6]ASJ10186.1 hypothetical protein A3L12_02190 [Thermococcus sp. P6]
MKLEVLSRKDMNALSRELSRAGIMNRTREEVTSEVLHYVVVRGTYDELVEKAGNVEPLQWSLEGVRVSFERMMENWKPGEAKEPEELLEEGDPERISVLTALMESGFVVEEEGGLLLTGNPLLDDLRLELHFPLSEIEDYLEELEERFETEMITEYNMEKRYFVEVIEVEGELIERALDVAGDYATEESIVEAMFEGIARSVLADTILKLAEKYRRKNELIKALMEMEPLVAEGKSGRVNVYFDEDALFDFLRDLQTLGYLKVKGNRIWV